VKEGQKIRHTSIVSVEVSILEMNELS